MAVTRIADGAVLSYGGTPTVNGAVIASFTATEDPGAGLSNGDLSLILTRTVRTVGGSPSSTSTLNTIAAFTADAAMPADIGSLGSPVTNSTLFSRIHDGTSDDWPDLTVTVMNSGNRLDVSTHRFAYRGGRNWTVADSGSLGPVSSGVTPADSVTLTLAANERALIISWAANADLATIPTIHTANSFTDQYNNDDPSNTATMPIRIADLHVTASGTYSLPRWNVTQGSSAGEHHAVWVAYTYLSGGGLHLDRLVFGTAGGFT